MFLSCWLWGHSMWDQNQRVCLEPLSAPGGVPRSGWELQVWLCARIYRWVEIQGSDCFTNLVVNIFCLFSDCFDCKQGMILILNVAGVNCEINIDNCATNPCAHGSCTDLANDYKCHCEVQWTGKNCDTKLDPCNPNPCHNSATCSASADFTDFSCYCPQGLTGKFTHL